MTVQNIKAVETKVAAETKAAKAAVEKRVKLKPDSAVIVGDAPVSNAPVKKIKPETPSVIISEPTGLPIKEDGVPDEMRRSPYSIAQFLALWFDEHFDRDGKHTVFVGADDLVSLIGPGAACFYETLHEVGAILFEEFHLAMATHDIGDCQTTAVIFSANADNLIDPIPASSVSEFAFVMLPAEHDDFDEELEDDFDAECKDDLKAYIKGAKMAIKENRAEYKRACKGIKKTVKKSKVRKALRAEKAEWKDCKKSIKSNIKSAKRELKAVKKALKAA